MHIGLFGNKKVKDDWRGRRRGKTITVTLSQELLTKVDIYAKRHGLKRSEVIRVALAEFFDRDRTNMGGQKEGGQSL